MKKLLLLVLAFALGGCASMRGVDVGTGGEEASYAVEVTNTRVSTVTLSYSQGARVVELGSVRAGATERFVIAGTSGAVTLVARNSAGASIGTYPVSPTAGRTTRITVR